MVRKCSKLHLSPWKQSTTAPSRSLSNGHHALSLCSAERVINTRWYNSVSAVPLFTSIFNFSLLYWSNTMEWVEGLRSQWEILRLSDQQAGKTIWEKMQNDLRLWGNFKKAKQNCKISTLNIGIFVMNVAILQYIRKYDVKPSTHNRLWHLVWICFLH